MTKKKLINSNLSFELERIKSYDKITLKQDEFANDVHKKIYTIEANDNSFFYEDEEERDKDLALLKEIFLIS